MFFVETKKPSIVIKKDAKPAFQLRRYAWSSKLPLSILTNFEEFIVYESRQRPHVSDKPDVERILSIPFSKYIEKWEEIYNIFSFEAVKQGSFDRYAEEAKKKRGTQEVDDEFLKEIEEWREELAKNIALRNPDLTVRELNYSVQRTIDRIIFLRMCEDKGIEKFGQLQSIAGKDNIYGHLCEVFKKADGKYNSGLFHFKKEKNRITLPDELTLKLIIEDNILKNIFRHLYYPNSPYEFSVLSPEILGNVYEQFLGKVIRLTVGHRAKVEEKPEVKKAGGVYYTPQYIVDHIVDNTVGTLIKGKTPKQISNLKILDPACGSGSFLLDAYSKLLQHHLDYYSTRKNLKTYKNQIYHRKNGEWNLTIKEKKRILLNNIFGVDIDSQAVEVTKLSLLLKVLEGESKDIFEKQQKLWTERALPDLGNNIKCGNSLIGPDFYKNFQTKLFDEDEIYRINLFDWNKEFQDIISDGGFDVVVSNPPYIRIQAMKEWAPLEVEFYKKRYISASKGNYDIYVVFVERSLELLKDQGKMGFILPHRFFKTDYGEPLRKLMLDRTPIDRVFDFDGFMVFKQASINTCILLNTKSPNRKNSFSYERLFNIDILSPEKIFDGSGKDRKIKIEKLKIAYKNLSSDYWNFIGIKEINLWNKINKHKTRDLGRLARIFVGLQTSMDKVFVLEIKDADEDYIFAKSRMDGQVYKLEKSICRPYIARIGVEPYKLPKAGLALLFPYDPNNNFKLFNSKQFSNRFPHTFDYLKKFEHDLRMREKGKFNDSEWYRYGRNQSISLLDDPKLIIQVISSYNRFCYDSDKTYFSGGGNGPYYGLRPFDSQPNILYFSGILNSNKTFALFLNHT